MIMESFPICMVAMEMGGWQERGESLGSRSPLAQVGVVIPALLWGEDPPGMTKDEDPEPAPRWEVCLKA